MKLGKVKLYRPEFDVEYNGVIGFFIACISVLWACIRIKKMKLQFMIGEKCLGEQERLAIIIPKYRLKRGISNDV
jgi:hypothetical protein